MVGKAFTGGFLSKAKTASMIAVVSAGLAACGVMGGGDDELESASSAGPAPAAQNENMPDVDFSVFNVSDFCPRLEPLNGTTIIQEYARGKQDDPRGLRYQATLVEWARTCSDAQDQASMKLGLAGRVTPGPAWKGGELLLPIRVAIVSSGDDEEKTVYSNLFRVPVTLGEGSPSEGWTLVEEGIVLPDEPGYKVIFGFDEK
ncbi:MULTISPECIES: hypothetical protein [Pseudovibrio]|uniref:hypothetical protein n=1 Tax=Stappiaceae TaxID=2821832 RepID=UPI002367082F|nr:MULTISPECIES: hypothetical protein [Pseudovibrio]MDD7911283.1 hypothetical protein [Pseudovibrio exalbescens]MDX5593030.1 hypothetical protein [Pseudovibrio sp. SPO723]